MRRLSQVALGLMVAVTANLAAHTEPAVSPPPLFDATAPPQSSSHAFPRAEAISARGPSPDWRVTADLPVPLQEVRHDPGVREGSASAAAPDPRPDPRYALPPTAVGLRLKLPF
jgi:hypothetical protein